MSESLWPSTKFFKADGNAEVGLLWRNHVDWDIFVQSTYMEPMIQTTRIPVLWQYTVTYTMKFGGQMEGLLGLSQVPVLTPVFARTCV